VYSVLEDIIELQLYLFGNVRIGNMEPVFFDRIQNEKDRLLQIVNDYNTALGCWHRLNILFLNQQKEPFEVVKEKGKQVIAKIMPQEDKGLEYSLTLRNRYLACFELYYNSIGDAENCYRYNKLLIENREIIDVRMPHFSVDAMAVYFNFMVACFKFKKWDEMETYLLKTKEYPIHSIEQEIRRAHNYCYNGMLLYLSTNQPAQTEAVIAVFDEARKKYAGRYRVDFLLFTQSLCGFYFFKTGRFDEAHKWWREIIDGPKYSVEIRTQATTRLYLILLHLAQNEWALLDYEINNVSRYIKSVHLMGEREKVFLEHCKKIAHNTQKKDAYSKLFIDLEKITAPLSEKSVVNSFIIEWVKEQA
jgi:tetratricopeptide (TPR) repeat protein